MEGKHEGRQRRLLVDFINGQEAETISASGELLFFF